MKKLSLEEFQQHLNILFPKEALEAIKQNGSKNQAIVKCRKCGKIYNKQGCNFLKKNIKSICKVCFPTHLNILKEHFDLPIGYSQIEKYAGMHNKILIKHDECGFIWKVTPNNLKLGKGCPKCNKKTSKGEQKILSQLIDNNIDYKMQVPLKIENYNFTIDFQLPSFDLQIEYNGEQHYKKINFFGGEKRFEAQLQNDNLKRQYLQSKLIEIPYTYFNNIEDILKSSTTISKESTQQALAAEVENLLSKQGE